VHNVLWTKLHRKRAVPQAVRFDVIAYGLHIVAADLIAKPWRNKFREILCIGSPAKHKAITHDLGPEFLGSTFAVQHDPDALSRLVGA